MCISPSATVLQNMETLPWSGTVHVTCEDRYKVNIKWYGFELCVICHTEHGNPTLEWNSPCHM